MIPLKKTSERVWRTGACAVLGLAFAACGAKTPTSPQGLQAYVGADGAPTLPANYNAEGWLHLGSWSVAPGTDKDVNQLHHVYAEASAVSAYKSTGKWPDGSTLVKELRSVAPKPMTTGIAAAGGEIDGWFVMVKRANRPTKDSVHWGDGWHGAQYSAKDPKVNVSPSWNSCRGCHLPVKDTDWVFVDGYPSIER